MYLCILDTNALSYGISAIYFTHWNLPHYSIDHFLCCKNIFSLRRSHLSTVVLLFRGTNTLFSKYLPVPTSWSVFPISYSISFRLLGLMLGSLILLEFNYVQHTSKDTVWFSWTLKCWFYINICSTKFIPIYNFGIF